MTSLRLIDLRTGLALLGMAFVGAEAWAEGPDGADLFAEQCVVCHDGANQRGGNHGPALKGADFWAKWQNQPARALYGRIISTMPLTDPGSLSEADVIQVVEFLMKENVGEGFPGPVTSANQLNDLVLPAMP